MSKWLNTAIKTNTVCTWTVVKIRKIRQIIFKDFFDIPTYYKL